MLIIAAVVLGISTIIFNEVKIVADSANAVSSLNAADAGIEKTLYFDAKKIPSGGTRGFCNICNACTDCNGCSLSGSSCGLTTCTACNLTYNSIFNGRTYTVSASVSPNGSKSNLIINSQGLYNGVTRTVKKTITK